MTRRGSSGGLLGVPLLVLAALLPTLSTFRRPEPVSIEEARASQGFSATHAASRLAVLAKEPRPVGSEAHEAALTQLLTYLRMQPVEVLTQAKDELKNVLARLPGTDSTGTLLLVAHHDSREETPGASDDGAAVVVLLDVLERLAEGPRPRNDVVVLLTDGEELGLLGARHFLDRGTWFEDVACVLNFDAIGNAGPPVLFQTGASSGHLVERFARSVPHPVTSSIAPFVYSLLPNDTDFTPFLETGRPGLNLALVGGGSAYHGPADRPENLPPGTLQLLGDTALALARDLGDADLSVSATEPTTYYDLAGRWVVRHGERTSWILGALAVLALALASGATARRNALGASELAQGLATQVVLGLATALLGFLVWYAIDHAGPLLAGGPSARPGRGNFESAQWTLIGLGLLGLFGIGAGCHALLRDRPGELPGSGARRLAGHVAGGTLLWIPFLAAALALGPDTAAQLPLAALAASVGVLAMPRLPLALPLGAALATALLAPHLALTFHLLSRRLDLAAQVLLLGVVAGSGLVVASLARHAPGRGWLTVLLLSGLAALGWGARIAALGG